MNTGIPIFRTEFAMSGGRGLTFLVNATIVMQEDCSFLYKSVSSVICFYNKEGLLTYIGYLKVDFHRL